MKLRTTRLLFLAALVATTSLHKSVTAQVEDIEDENETTETTPGDTPETAPAPDDTVEDQEDEEIVDQRAVLLEFYEATGGASSWAVRDGWATDSDNICEWLGVICQGESDPLLEPESGGRRRTIRRGRGLQEEDEDDTTDDDTTEEEDSAPSTPPVVVGLRLTDNYLTGRTPVSLWTLPYLTHIDFSFNPLLQVTFAGLEQAKSIHTIKMHATGTASVVGIGAAAPSLVSFHVSGAPLQSMIPNEIFELTKLEYLHMSDCALMGGLSSELSQLGQLRALNVAENSLTGTLPTAISSLQHLRILAVSMNQFRGPFPNLDDIELLHQLYADGNAFTGSLPDLSVQPGLSLVHVQNNAFNGEIPNNFFETRAVSGDTDSVTINLSNNQLSGQVPASLDRLAALEVSINLADNDFESVASELCDNVNWNSNDSSEVVIGNCDAFLCGMGTYAVPYGRATRDATCAPCPETVDKMGSSSCPHQDDRSILREIYSATSGGGTGSSDSSGSWKNSVGYDNADSTDFCTWYGVTCWETTTENNGHVRMLMLPNNGLQGTLPESVFNLRYLTTLDVSRNNVVLPFTGINSDRTTVTSLNIASTQTTDFTGIEQARGALRFLYADRLALDGTLPNEVYELSLLEVLSMTDSQLKGEITSDISQLEALQELYLNGNNLRGTISTYFGDLVSLRTLSLAKNQLTGGLPTQLENLSNLQALSLMDQINKGGGITGELLEFRNMPLVSSLMLSDNLLEGEIPSTLLGDVDLDTTVSVDLSNNQLSGSLPGSLARFERLSIFVQGNALSGIDTRLCAMENWMGGLVRTFECNAILCPAGTAGGRQEYSDVPCQPCSTSTDATTNATSLLGQATCSAAIKQDLTAKQILERLYEQGGGVGWHNRKNWMSGDAHFCDWYGITCDDSQAITAIELGANQLIGILPTELYQLPQLEKLTLYSNNIKVSFEGIENAANLKTLVLDSTGLDSLAGIGQARSLEQLNVRSNKIAGHLPQELSRLVALRTLGVAENQISGTVPSWLASLESLTTFLAAHNKFSGPIYDFSSLRNVVYLDLSHNELTGSIPPTLLEQGDRNSRIVVDLSDNALTGFVPGELNRFMSLTLNLINNQLTGISQELCNMESWNDNDVGKFGCDGIMCPAGYGNEAGRQTSVENPCVPCSNAKFLGSALCGGLQMSGGPDNTSVLLGLALTLSLATLLSLWA